MGFDAFQNEKKRKKKKMSHIPTTSRVNWKPCLMDLRCTWLGRLAKPTKPESFFYFEESVKFFSKKRKKKENQRKDKELTTSPGMLIMTKT